MQKKKQRKVNFRISHCTSQDPQYPVSELLLQSPDAKGWQSKRYQSFPQMIIVDLLEPTLLRQISFLSHQSKIATRIQIQARLEENKQWKKLGYVSLTSNENTNYQARQLRTANLNGIPACSIKLTFRNNHFNSHNPFNQVGLISLSIYGDKMIQSNFTSTTTTQGTNPITQTQTLQFDKQTLQKLKQLQIRKKQAVDNQQFDTAKNIKDQIQRIKSVGQTLILMEQKKQQAIKRQDYQNAKIINDSMKKLRDQNNFGPNLSNKPSGNPSQFIKNQQKKNQYHEQQQQQNTPMNNNNRTNQQFNNNNNQNNNHRLQKQVNQQVKPKSQQAPLHNEDRPLDVKGSNKQLQQFPEQQQQRQDQQLQNLNKQIFAQCQPYFDILDQQIFRLLYSKDHKNRQTGIRMIKEKLNQKIFNKQAFIEAILFAIKITIQDRIASVLIMTLELFDQFMRKMKPQTSQNNVMHAQFILQKMADYLGHTNPKILSITQSLFGNFPIYNLTSKDLCYQVLTMTYKRQKPPKILTGRLKMISRIISQYQLGKSYDQVIKYAVKYVDDKNNDIRNAAINIILEISKQIGYNSLQPFLKNVRPQIIKTIEEQIIDNGQNNNDDRPYDQKPIKSGNNNKNKKQMNQIEAVQNQFIAIPKNKTQQNQQFICPYCKKFDERFAEQDFLDMHWFHACPMLTFCVQCKNTIQISYLTAHLVGQCQNSKFFKKCPRCKQSVHQKNYKAHTEKKQCLSAKPLAAANRCPLCHLDIPAGQDGWRIHLVQQGCQNNPRK